ncbi:MAG: hypothetical protein HY059_20810 [Proteobacteria bacterium]|nr:hypothetical protein [Pseudomonadota bacterium]
MPGMVHVSGYLQRRNGQMVDVADYDRGAPAGGGVKPWHGKSNRKFREEIAKAERSSDKPHDGYREHARISKALGRYQLTPIALADIEWRNLDGTWTKEARKHGVRSDHDFLSKPSAQEDAFTAYMRRNEEQLQANGSKHHVGEKYCDHEGKSVKVTEAGLAASAHREGARATKDALDKLKSKRDGNPREFTDAEKRAIKRMRDFADVPYDIP